MKICKNSLVFPKEKNKGNENWVNYSSHGDNFKNFYISPVRSFFSLKQDWKNRGESWIHRSQSLTDILFSE